MHFIQHRFTEENPRWGPSDGGVLKGMTLDYMVYTSVEVPPPPPLVSLFLSHLTMSLIQLRNPVRPSPPPLPLPQPHPSPPTSPPDHRPPLVDPPTSPHAHTIILVILFILWTLREIVIWRRTRETRVDPPSPPLSYYGGTYNVHVDAPSDRTPLNPSSDPPPRYSLYG